MATLKITLAQANELLNARKMNRSARLAVKKRVFAQIHKDHNLPKSQKIKLFIENPSNKLYCVIRDKRTGTPLDNGLPEAALTTGTAPKGVGVKKPAVQAPVKKAPVKKAPAKKVAVKAAAKKAPVKKVAVKAPVKAAAKKAPAKLVKKAEKPAFSKTRTDKCNIEVRASIAGVRTRLGWASTEAMKERVIAKARAEAAKA